MCLCCPVLTAISTAGYLNGSVSVLTFVSLCNMCSLESENVWCFVFILASVQVTSQHLSLTPVQSGLVLISGCCSYLQLTMYLWVLAQTKRLLLLETLSLGCCRYYLNSFPSLCTFISSDTQSVWHFVLKADVKCQYTAAAYHQDKSQKNARQMKNVSLFVT